MELNRKQLAPTLAAVLLAGAGALSTACSPGESGQAIAAPLAADASAEKTVKPLTPDGWIVLREEAVIPVIDDVSRHLARAHAAYLDEQLGQAGGHLKEAAELLENDNNRGADNHEPALEATTEELEKIADELSLGNTVSEETLTSALVAAHRAEVAQLYRVDRELAFVAYYEQPQNHFEQADRDLAANDLTAAAQEIHKGAAYLSMEATAAEGEAKEELLRSTEELKRLAHDLGVGATVGTTKVKQAFARASHARSLNHLAAASRSWANQEAAKAGHGLRAASTDIADGLKWSGHAIDGASSALEGVRLLSGKMIEGGGWVADEVGQGIETAGSELRKLGEWLSSVDLDSTS